MTNLANTQVFLEDITTERPLAQPQNERIAFTIGASRKKNSRARSLSHEDQQIMTALNTVKRELDCLHNRYDQITDPLLVDSIIYELKAAHMKYKYYLHLCKEKGIIGGV